MLDLDALGLSLAIALASTVIAALVGMGTALVIVNGRWCGRIVAATSPATVTIPHLIGAAAVGLLLADSGLLARVLGVPPELWPALVGGPWWVAVVAEYAWKESAFIGLVVAGTLITRIARFDEAAALLGAGRWKRFRFVMFPPALPALAISSTIAFGYTLGSYEVAWLLGRTYPEPLVAPALARAAFLAFLVGWSDYVVTVVVGGGQIVTLPLVTGALAAGIGNDAAVAVLSLSAIVPPLALLTLAGLAGRQPRGTTSPSTPDVGEPR